MGDALDPVLRSRTRVAGALVLSLFCVLGARLVNQQAVHAEHWRALATKQQEIPCEVPAYRGDIRTADGVVLARSVRAPSAFAAPRFMSPREGERATPEDVAKAAHEIAAALGYDAQEERRLLGRFVDARGNPRGFAWIERRLDADRARRLSAAKVVGVSFKDEYRREYPQGELAAQLVGVVNLTGTGEVVGTSGVELLFQNELAGVSGLREVVRDARGGSIVDEGMLTVPPEDGASVTLTIDSVLERMATEVLAKGAREWSPQSAKITVLSPRDGRILALASWPAFDPGSIPRLRKDASHEEVQAFGRRFKNGPLEDFFEPGSIVKPLIVATALDLGVITSTSTFDCTSPRHVGARPVVDKHPKPGLRTPLEILTYSLNCGMVQIAPLIGPERLHEMLLRCGFAEKTGLGIRPDVRGAIPPLRRWMNARYGYHDTVSVAQGYALMVSQIQMASAFASFGNDGVRLRPQIVEEISDPRGFAVRRFKPEEAGRLCSKRVLDEVIIPALANVVREGTARKAALDRYRIGGKTGTAKLLVGRGYDSKRDVSSLCCLAPIEAPRLLVLVTLEDPKSKNGVDPSGGTVAGPIVRDFLEQALPYLRVPPSPPEDPAAEPAARRAMR